LLRLRVGAPRETVWRPHARRPPSSSRGARGEADRAPITAAIRPCGPRLSAMPTRRSQRGEANAAKPTRRSRRDGGVAGRDGQAYRVGIGFSPR
jgi:hypothetical protein